MLDRIGRIDETHMHHGRRLQISLGARLAGVRDLEDIERACESKNETSCMMVKIRTGVAPDFEALVSFLR